MRYERRKGHRHSMGVLIVSLAVILPVLGILSTFGWYARRNQEQFVSEASALSAVLNRDETEGVAPRQLNPVRMQLKELKVKRLGLVPASWLGLSATQSQLHALQLQTNQVWSADVSKRRHQAIDVLSKLQLTEGAHFQRSEDEHALAEANTPVAIAALTNQWSAELQQWTNDENKLKQLAGGLKGGRPADVLQLEASLRGQLSNPFATEKDKENGQAALSAATTYLLGTPSQQIMQHSNITAQLHAAITTLQRDTIPEISLGDGLFNSQFANYIHTRQDVVSVAVYDADNGKTYVYNPNAAFATASIVKVTIMADLLYQSHGQPLPKTEQQLMPPMIEDSSNTAATTLWNLAGGDAGIQDFVRLAGLTHTTAGAADQWGLTETTALDQVNIVKLLAYPNHILTDSERSYGLSLMEHVTAWEDWGVSSAAAGHAAVALKNGWLPYPSKWWINSIGYVNGDGRNYVIAILSQGNPSEQYGIQTDDTISNMVWDALAG